MEHKQILYMLSPQKHASPFDINMALDAGYDAVFPYSDVKLDEIASLVQDAMFSRAPKDGVRTGIFFAGKDASLALDMLEAAAKALVPPFGVSLFADPAGSFTTAAALVACVEKLLKERKERTLVGQRVAIFGATGVVGFAAGAIAAREGARVTLVGYDGPERVRLRAQELNRRFGVGVEAADGSTEESKARILSESDVVFCTGRAGTRILTQKQIAAAPHLSIAADVNAVPPLGIEGLEANAKGTSIGSSGALGLGALSIGNVKYQTESGLFRQMIAASRPVRFDFRDAFRLARDLNA